MNIESSLNACTRCAKTIAMFTLSPVLIVTLTCSASAILMNADRLVPVVYSWTNAPHNVQ